MTKQINVNIGLPYRWLLASAVAGGVFFALVRWFALSNFYYDHFFDHGTLVTEYSIARFAFIGMIAWLIWSVGASVLWLASRGEFQTSVTSSIDRFVLGFLTGAGIWQSILFAVGLAGSLNLSVVIVITLLAALGSGPHLYSLVAKIPSAKALWVMPAFSKSVGPLAMAAFATLVIALFIATKGLYPAGGHDYYTHYFQYYMSVIRNGSILPNDVWYHFYYSKGAGLYFQWILLTDPLAPQLVTTAFIFVGATIVYSLLRTGVSGRFIPWFGSVLYIAFLIYTPGPLENMRQGGWADLEKVHEPAAVLFLGIVWITARLGAADRGYLRVWLVALSSAIVAAALFSTAIAFFIGAYLALTLLWWLVKRNGYIAKTILISCCVCAGAILTILYVNFSLTGLPLDQLVLTFWPIVDLEKINSWGVLNEFLVLHWALTGYLANKVPLSWDVLPLVATYLRLEIWWPIFVLGTIVTFRAVRAKHWGILDRSPDLAMAITSLGTLLVTFVLLAIGLGAGRQQPISFYRFSSFMYGPMLCLGLSFCSLLPAKPPIRGLVGAGMAALLLTIAGLASNSALYGRPVSDYARGIGNGFSNVLTNASFLLRGRFSLRDAYQNQQGWPGRMPWGGIYPPMEKISKIVGPDTPIYSMHIHTYCMLPRCRITGFMSTSIGADENAIFFKDPNEGIAALKAAGANYFLVSKELKLYTPIVLSPIFSPENIGKYLGVKWTDGTAYLLTWSEDARRPIDEGFLAAYRQLIAESPTAISFPLAEFHKVYEHFQTQGLKPYAVPWCTTCNGMAK